MLQESELEDSQKRTVFERLISDSRADFMESMGQYDVQMDDFLGAYSQYATINAMDMSASEKAREFSKWVAQQGYIGEKAEVLKEEFAYFSMIPADAEKYDELVDGGLPSKEADELLEKLDTLEPEEGMPKVSDVQRWRACVDVSQKMDYKLAALAIVMNERQMEKVDIAYKLGVDPEHYVKLYEIRVEHDTDGSGTYKNSEIQSAIDAMPGNLSKSQKAVLWQLVTGSSSAKNNPYDVSVGQQVLDEKNKS